MKYIYSKMYIYCFLTLVSELSKTSWNQQHFALLFPKPQRPGTKRRSPPSQLRDNTVPVSIKKITYIILLGINLSSHMYDQIWPMRFLWWWNDFTICFPVWLLSPWNEALVTEELNFTFSIQCNSHKAFKCHIFTVKGNSNYTTWRK